MAQNSSTVAIFSVFFCLLHYILEVYPCIDEVEKKSLQYLGMSVLQSLYVSIFLFHYRMIL